VKYAAFLLFPLGFTLLFACLPQSFNIVSYLIYCVLMPHSLWSFRMVVFVVVLKGLHNHRSHVLHSQRRKLPLAVDFVPGLWQYRGLRAPVLGVLLHLEDQNDGVPSGVFLLRLHGDVQHRVLFALRYRGRGRLHHVREAHLPEHQVRLSIV